MSKQTRKENKMQFKSNFMKLLLRKQAKEGREIPVAEIAEATSLSRQTVYNWKNGIQVDSLDSDTAFAFTRYFDAELNELVEFVPRPDKQ